VTTRDRRELLLSPANTTLNGIDFVEVASADQTHLRIHFLTTVAVQGTLTGGTRPVTITGGEVVRSVRVLPFDESTAWSVDGEGRPILALTTDGTGDFSNYTLQISSTVLDPFFDHCEFSFKANCPSDLDCEEPPAPCPADDGDRPPIDYLAKDFQSFAKALSEFSALRYPEWVERSEADFGVMALEALSALFDDLSYQQDRVAAEADLDTATERSSLISLARLVDYEPRPATVASVALQLEVQAIGKVDGGFRCRAAGPDGQPIDFEVGTSLADPVTADVRQESFDVDPRWNRLTYPAGQPNLVPYWWDDSERCLEAGALGMWIEGKGHGFVAGDPVHDIPGQTLLIDTAGPTTADPPVRQFVHVATVTEQTDPLTGHFATRITWPASDALVRDHDLTRTVLAGNIVPATQGRRRQDAFVVPLETGQQPVPPAGGVPPTPALVRLGRDWRPDASRPSYLHTVGDASLAWQAGDEVDGDTAMPARPEVVLVEEPVAPAVERVPWRWRRRMLGAQALDRVFSIVAARYAPVMTAQDGSAWYDYDGDDGATIRFGDGEFGILPELGTVFTLTRREGGGAIGNVGADTITVVPKDQPLAALVLSCTNPFPAEGGQDQETAQQIRDRAPQQFRARPLRVVRASDYERAAYSLPWVSQAGTSFRWTGSWLSVFTAADPKGGTEMTSRQALQLVDLLERRRLAGYESFVELPRYVSVDVIVTLCALASHFRGDVEEAVLLRLGPGRLLDGTLGFFDPDRFSFGSPLERSSLDAAIQSVGGVDGVRSVLIRRRGIERDFIELTDTATIGPDQVFRMDNDPSRPEAGSLRVIVEGGK